MIVSEIHLGGGVHSTVIRLCAGWPRKCGSSSSTVNRLYYT